MKLFPIQSARVKLSGKCAYTEEGTKIPWWLAEIAYDVYSSKYGASQSLERLAERGGFGRSELLWLLRGGEGACITLVTDGEINENMGKTQS